MDTSSSFQYNNSAMHSKSLQQQVSLRLDLTHFHPEIVVQLQQKKHIGYVFEQKLS